MLYLSAVFMAATTTASCGSFRQGDPVGTVEEVDADYINRDSTLYGICGRATTTDRLQLLTDMGDTLIISMTEAKTERQVFGTIKTGDRLAVVANSDSTKALKIINVTAMLGDWVMEDNLDGGDEVGISLKDGGMAESINYTTIQYTSWRLINGQLELVNTRDDGIDFEEITLYNILYIGPDSLVFQEETRPDNKNREDLFEYSRQKPKENFDPGFELEESNFEDFVF